MCFAAAEMIVKVKEPQPEEVPRDWREDQVLFTYLHLAADRKLTEALLRSGAVAIAYETVTDRNGGLPLLAPMSEVSRADVGAGRSALPGEGTGRARHPLGRRARRRGGEGRHSRRRRPPAPMRRAWRWEWKSACHGDRSVAGRGLYELDMQFGSQLHTLFSTVENIERENRPRPIC